VGTEQELRLEIENLDLRRLLAQAGIDAAEQKVVERLQRLLVEELHHRIKNTLAIVIAITSQSLRTAKNLEHGRGAVMARLVALGRIHDLLLQTNWTSATLGAVLKSATEPFDASGSGRFFIQSSDIRIDAAAVLPLAMILNELCTNAVKYGALSNADGHVNINAAVDDSGSQFLLRWVEFGGPSVAEPTHRSFGTRLIEQSFVSQLQGQAKLAFEPSGVVCTLTIPIASLKPPQESF
jgi:two-component sensor histidine kinase